MDKIGTWLWIHIRSVLFGVAVVLFIIAGTYLIRASHAAAPFVSTESEAGIVLNGATILSDANASSGKAVRFPNLTPSPPPPGPGGPSGVPMPVGNLSGWTQVFADDFTTNVPLGSFPGADSKWDAGYKDGTKDTGGQQGQPSAYYPSKVLSIQNGVLDMYLHNSGGTFMGAAPQPKFSNSAGYSTNSLTYGRVSVRYKSDSLKGFKTAWLMWPNSEAWSDGEIDFPESDLSGVITGANHWVGNPGQFTKFSTTAYTTSWHTATFEWTPGKVQFFLDGTSIGTATTSTPNKPMHYIMQTESCYPSCPSTNTAGHLQVDWVTVYKQG